MSDGTPAGRDGERLQKVLAAAGVASRRVVEQYMVAGRVSVNGEVVTELGRRVDPAVDHIAVDGQAVQLDPAKRYLMLNKPTGVVSSLADERGRPDLRRWTDELEERVFNVGRLDADTSGLLLLTNDGELANRVAHPRHGVAKEYLTTVSGGAVSPAAIRRLREGVQLEDGPTAPAKVSQPEPGVLRITIHEGRNRQVRRMCEAVGHPVTRLVRTRIGPLRDHRLAPGTWRLLTQDEVRQLALETARYHSRP
jgi:pseudouridine synthase